MNQIQIQSLQSPLTIFKIIQQQQNHNNCTIITTNNLQKKEIKTTTAGFEPARAKPNRFLVCLLNHSDKLSWKPSPTITTYSTQEIHE